MFLPPTPPGCLVSRRFGACVAVRFRALYQSLVSGIHGEVAHTSVTNILTYMNICISSARTDSSSFHKSAQVLLGEYSIDPLVRSICVENKPGILENSKK